MLKIGTNTSRISYQYFTFHISKIICSKRACVFFTLIKYDSRLVSFCLFVFVALRPMSTAMVIAGRSVHLTTLFPGQA